MTDFPDLLSALGRVEPPSPAALDAAREVLWSAVADEMLATDPAGDLGRRGADRPRRTGQQREAGRPQRTGEQREVGQPGRTGEQREAGRPQRTGEQGRGDPGPRRRGGPGP
jgi:hypothetical protein